MQITDLYPGQIVRLNADPSPNMVVVAVYRDQYSADCRYWNEKKGGFDETALFAHELIKIEERDKSRVVVWDIGDRVRYYSSCPVDLVIAVDKFAEEANTYTCSFYNPVSGRIEQDDFYGLELKEWTEEVVPEMMIVGGG